MSTGFLKVKGTKIVDKNDNPVVLVGSALGGSLNMENFITGYPGTETEHKEALLKSMGKEKFDYFFKKFYEYWWMDEDAKFFKSLNFNCLRIPINYHHFIDDSDLFKIKSDAFDILDRYINICSKNEIYSIIDLHTVPGGQNQDWHSDSGLHKAIFWTFGHFQDAIVNLWKEIAIHYKDNKWVAGYNLLNEPADSKHYRLVNFYNRTEKSIRSVDPNHILYVDGNTYAGDFRQFPKTPYPNTVYSIHDYVIYGFPGFETYVGSQAQKAKLNHQYERKIEPMKELQVPVWNGEFGPVYASEVRGDSNVEETNRARYAVLKDQLEIYKHGDSSGDKSPISWTIWLYKDIGYQGLVYVSPNSKWYKLLGPWLQKKKSLGIDKWGNDCDPKVQKLYTDLIDHFEEVIPKEHHKALYPPIWTIKDYVQRVSRELVLSQYLGYEFADYFKDLSFDELDELAASFKFENVQQRSELNKILSDF